MKPSTCKIVWVHPSTIRPAPGNPERRTRSDGRKMKDLLRRMSRLGFEEFRPILVSREGIIGDGHRRYACALILDLQEVPVIFTGKSHIELFEGNAGAAAVTGAHWIQAYVNGMCTISEMPSEEGENVKNLEAAGGRELLKWLAERNVSPGIFVAAYRAGRYCGDTSNSFLLRAVIWSVTFKMQRRVHDIIKAGHTPPAIIKAAIENERTIADQWLAEPDDEGDEDDDE